MREAGSRGCAETEEEQSDGVQQGHHRKLGLSFRSVTADLLFKAGLLSVTERLNGCRVTKEDWLIMTTAE